MEPGQRKLLLRSEWHRLTAISYSILNEFEPNMYDMTSDIECQCDLQYCLWYQHTITKCACSTSKSWNLDISNPVYDHKFVTVNIEQWDLRYRTPSISNTFDIDIQYRRCRTLISYEPTISKSSMSNVTFDVKGPTLDIVVARIQMLVYTAYMIILDVYRHGDLAYDRYIPVIWH
jgi:hypothetical protein